MKSWTVRAKQHINSQIPKGFIVQNVITQQNCHDYPTLQKTLANMGIRVGSGVWSDTFWEWS